MPCMPRVQPIAEMVVGIGTQHHAVMLTFADFPAHNTGGALLAHTKLPNVLDMFPDGIPVARTSSKH